MAEIQDPKETWWMWRHVQQRLIKWTLALLQGRRYTVRLVCVGTACEDPDYRVIQANPQLFNTESPSVQFRATQGLLAHEVGHALFTSDWPGQEENLLCRLVNELEDERIERAICVYYPGVKAAIHLLGTLAYKDIKSFDFAACPSLEVLPCCLVWRWAHSLPAQAGRTNEAEMLDRMKLSAPAQKLWDQVKPLVEQAWTAPDTKDVIQLARDILKILDLNENLRADVFPGLPGSPTGGIPIKRDTPALPLPGNPAPWFPGGGRGVDDSECPNVRMDHYTWPAPYVELEDEARPLARRLSESLKEPQPDVRPLPHEWRGRYSFRQETRTPDTPHLSSQAVDKARRSLAMIVLVDRSGSMADVQEAVHLAVMTVYLAATDLGIPIGVKYFGSDRDMADEDVQPMEVAPLSPQASEPAKALIAGFEGETCEEFLAWALRAAEKDLASRPERLRVVLVIHDGEPVYVGRRGNDWNLSLAQLREMERTGLTPIGVYLGEGTEEIEKLKRLFKHLVITNAHSLPDKLGGLLMGLA